MAGNSDVQISISIIDQNGQKAVVELQGALQGLAAAGETAGAATAAGLDKVGSHALTNLDNVRLLRDDLGIRIPRAMEKAIASSQLLSGALSTVGTGLIAFGAVEIFTRMGEQVYNLYEKYLDVGAAAKAYQEQVEKTRDEDLINPRSIETAIERFSQATTAAQGFKTAAESMSGNFWSDVMSGFSNGGVGSAFSAGLMDTWGARQIANEGFKNQGVADALNPKILEMQHQLALGQIELTHASDGQMQGQAKITAELQKQLEINRANQAFAQDIERAKGNTNPADAGYAARAQKDAIAAAQAHAKEVELARTEHDEIVRLQQDATMAGLTGNAQLEAQREAALNKFTEKYGASAAARAAIDAEFQARALAQQDELDAKTRKAAEDATLAGMTGISRIQAETAFALEALDKEEQKAIGPGGKETPAQSADFTARRASATQIGNQKQLEAEDQFYQQLRQMQQSYDTSSSEGYARIAEDAQRSIDRVQEEFHKAYGQMSQWDMAYQVASIAAGATVDQIRADADLQRERLHQRTMDSLTKEEEQAAKDMLPPWLAAELAIVDAYRDRVEKAKQLEDDQLAHVKKDSEDAKRIQADYNKEVLVAAQVRDAQMVHQMQETRDKLAGELQSFFSNPAQFIEKKAMDAAFQYLANDMLAVFQKDGSNPIVKALEGLFGMGGSPSTSTNPGEFGKSLLGSGQTAIGTTFTTAGTTMLSAAQMMVQAATRMATVGMGSAGGASGGGLGSLLSGLGGSSDASAVGAGVGDIGSSALGMAMGTDASSAGAGVGDVLGSAASSATGLSTVSGGNAAGKYLGAAGGAIAGGLGLYNAYETSNPLGGAVSGMMLGASLGSVIPGVGTAVGAVIGAAGGLLAGLFGDQGRGQAQSYDQKTVQPGIASELDQYNSGRTGYAQVSQYLNQLQISAAQQSETWGRGAYSWYNQHIVAEIQAAQAQLNAEEKAGRSQISVSAAQYHTGGMIGDFGDYGTSDTEGFIHAKAGEFVVHDGAVPGNTALLSAINAGRTITPAAAQGSRMVAASGGSGSQIVITAWDGKSVDTWLRNGGATQLRQGLNQATGQYGGVGIR